MIELQYFIFFLSSFIENPLLQTVINYLRLKKVLIMWFYSVNTAFFLQLSSFPLNSSHTLLNNDDKNLMLIKDICSTSSKIKKLENKWNLSFRKFSLKIESQKNLQSHIYFQMVINWILIWGSKTKKLQFFNKWFIYMLNTWFRKLLIQWFVSHKLWFYWKMRNCKPIHVIHA